MKSPIHLITIFLSFTLAAPSASPSTGDPPGSNVYNNIFPFQVKGFPVPGAPIYPVEPRPVDHRPVLLAPVSEEIKQEFNFNYGEDDDKFPELVDSLREMQDWWGREQRSRMPYDLFPPPLQKRSTKAEEDANENNAKDDPKAKGLEVEEDITTKVQLLLYNRTISSPAMEAVEICKSYAFEPTQPNYVLSGTDIWLRAEALRLKDTPYFKQHGLMSTLAFDYLGLAGWTCGIGMASLCNVECTTVVERVSDLEVARRVWFALRSARNLALVSEMVHDGLIAAELNVGLMADKMAYDYFWWHRSLEEQRRELAFQFFISVGIWSAQTAFSAAVPIVPWGSIQSWMLGRISQEGIRKSLAGEHIAFEDIPEGEPHPALDHEFNEWREKTLVNALQEAILFESPINTVRVPARYATPDYKQALHDWLETHRDTLINWETWTQDPLAQSEVGPSDPQPFDRFFDNFIENFRWSWTNHGFNTAVGEAMAEVTDGTVERVDGRWMWRDGSSHDEPEQADHLSTLLHLDQLLNHPKSNLPEGALISSHGPMRDWGSNDRWRILEHANDGGHFVADIWARGLQARGQLDPKQPGLGPVALKRIDDALTRSRNTIDTLRPVGTAYMFPVIARHGIDRVLWTGTEMGRDWNVANLQESIQRSVSAARKMIKTYVNDLYFEQEVAEDGSTELTDILALGSYAPADSSSLRGWSSGGVEEILTRNIFFKTLNIAYKTQKTYITCTSHLVRPEHPNRLTSKLKPVKDCADDTSGPENVRACVNNRVCYMYRWNDRGFHHTHHHEEPFGLAEMGADPWNLKVTDIIISSVLSHRLGGGPGESDTEFLYNPTGPDASFITDPTTPGLFTIPVCDTPVSWNGPTTPRRIFADDANPLSAHKVLPCYCGPLGNHTRAVWDTLRLDAATNTAVQREYKLHRCPLQISKKLSHSPLDRYLALCRLGVRFNDARIGHMDGPDVLCDVVIEQLEAAGVAAVTELLPEHVTAFLCKIDHPSKLSSKLGFGRWGVTHKQCEPYVHTGVERVWHEALEVIVAKQPKEVIEAWDAARMIAATAATQGREGLPIWVPDVVRDERVAVIRELGGKPRPKPEEPEKPKPGFWTRVGRKLGFGRDEDA